VDEDDMKDFEFVGKSVSELTFPAGTKFFFDEGIPVFVLSDKTGVVVTTSGPLSATAVLSRSVVDEILFTVGSVSEAAFRDKVARRESKSSAAA